MSALVANGNTTPRKNRASTIPRTATEEEVNLTPVRGRGSKANVVSPARVRDERITDKISIRLNTDTAPSSPVRGKANRTYKAPASPGKSPKKSSIDLSLKSVSSGEEEEEDIKQEKVCTPKKGAFGRPLKGENSTSSQVTLSPAPGSSAGANAGAGAKDLGSPTINRAKISARVEKAYGIVRSCTGILGGNGSTGAIYGELTMGSMQKVINIMVDKCEMNSSSRFIDVGSGLGKPNFHAAQDPQVRLSVGVELETIRWQLAMFNLQSVVGEMQRGKPANEKPCDITRETALLSGVNFMVGDIDDASSTDPFTHIYMYDLGFPPPLQQSIARKFNNSHYAQYLVSYRPPRRVIEEYGYAVEIVDQISTSMHGSGEGHMAYFYKRINTPPTVNTAIKRNLLLPARPGFKGEKDEEVVCDPAFLACSELAVGDIAPLADHAREVVRNELLSSTRPVRNRMRTQIVDLGHNA